MDIYNILSAFNTESVQKATVGLLSYLGIKGNVFTNEELPITSVFDSPTKVVSDISKKINESYFACTISDLSFDKESEKESLEEAKAKTDKYEQIFVFAIGISDNERINRSEIATITRALNSYSKAAPVLLITKYYEDGNMRVALSLCERTAYKQAGHTGEKAGKVNILRGVNPEKPHTGHIRILEEMRLEKEENTFETVYKKWLKVFDNDVLTSKFYEELQNWFFWALKSKSGVRFPNDINDDKDDMKYNPQNIIRLITRLIFVWFLREKGLVPKELFDRDSLDKIVKNFKPDNFKSSTYYRVILQNLFFATLNKRIEERSFVNDDSDTNKTLMRHAEDLNIKEDEFIKMMRPVPFMNNSLFECLDNKIQDGKTYNWDGFSIEVKNKEKQSFVPNYLFFAKEDYVDLSKEYERNKAKETKVFGLINILNRYAFTVEENTPLDQDVALDPELLGKVFENLLAAYNPETENTVRKSTGSYYTPRPIVQFMVDEALIQYLKKSVPSVREEDIRNLLSYDELSSNTLSFEQTRNLASALLSCKILDPACGSGAFPMGMLQQMSYLLSRIDKDNSLWEDVVIERALNDETIAEGMSNIEKDDLKKEIENVFDLSTHYPDYARKLYLIENCIYGVDLQSIAVQITRLRFFISLLCEQEADLSSPETNYNIKPLPNLEMKFVSANTLVGLEQVEQKETLFTDEKIINKINELKEIRHDLFLVSDNQVKEELRIKDNTTRTEIMSLIENFCKGDIIERINQDLRNIEELRQKIEELKQSDGKVVTASLANLFDGEAETIEYKSDGKEKQIKEISLIIKRNERDLKIQMSLLNSGKDKVMKLASQLTEWNPYDQNVSSSFFDPDWMFGIKGGFDIVIGNPPYIKEYTNKKAFDCIRKSPYYQGKMDIWYAFACIGFDQLRNDGLLCFIATNNWTTNDGASVMRNKMIGESTIKRLVDFNNYMVFGGSASIQTMVMLFSKEVTKKNYSFEYQKLRKATLCSNELLSFLNKDFKDAEYIEHKIDRCDDLNKTLTFYKDDSEQVLNKMVIDCSYLSKDEVAQGIVFPQDFLNRKGMLKLGNYNVGDGIFVLSQKELDSLNLCDNEKELIKPYFTSEQICQYTTNPKNTLWMIYTDSSFKKPTSLKNFPNIKNHLDKFKKIFTSDNKPYGLHRSRNPKFFTSEKVLALRKCVGHPLFSYAPFDTFVSQTFYSIVSTQFNAKYLTGLLNSKLIEFWLRNKGKMQGDNFQIDKDPLLCIPIKIGFEEEIISLVDKIIKKKTENELDESLQIREVIDYLVYRIYNLTYEEVLVVDPETPITREEYESQGY